MQRIKRALQLDKGVQTEGWTSRILGRRQAEIDKEERSTQTDLNLDILESISEELKIEQSKLKSDERKSTQTTPLVNQTTQTDHEISKTSESLAEKAIMPESSKKEELKETPKKTKILKKKRHVKDASAQTSVSTTVPTPALRRMSIHAPLLIAREEATQTLEKLMKDSTSQTDLH